MRMLWACINLQLAKDGTTEAILWDHAVNGTLDNKLRAALAYHAWSLDLFAADPTREASINLLALLVSAKANLVGIDHHDEIAGVNVGSKNRLVQFCT